MELKGDAVHPLSLHQVIAPDASPAELVRTARDLACDYVCLFTQPPGAAFPFPVVQDSDIPELLKVMADARVSVLATTTFPITPNLRIEDYLAGFERSERLGSRIGSVRLLDTERARSAEKFGRLAELAARHGIELSIEFVGFEVQDALDEALWVIGQAGRGKISFDSLHIVRTGASIGTLRGLDPSMIGYVQFSDGPLRGSRETYAREGGFDRLPPGDGEFPLADLLAIVPDGMPISLEVPQEPARQAGVSIAERCQRAVLGMRRLMAARSAACADH